MPKTEEIMLQVRQIIEEHLHKQEADRQKRLQYLNDLIDAIDLQNGWPKPDLIFTTREQAEAWGLKIEEAPENDD